MSQLLVLMGMLLLPAPARRSCFNPFASLHNLSDDGCCHHTLLSVPGLYEGIFQSCEAAATSMGISYPRHRPMEPCSQLKAPPKALQVMLDTKQCARDILARRTHIFLYDYSKNSVVVL